MRLSRKLLPVWEHIPEWLVIGFSVANTGIMVAASAYEFWLSKFHEAWLCLVTAALLFLVGLISLALQGAISLLREDK
jgi:hypothetical protein